MNTDNPITIGELADLFGERMPIEAATMIAGWKGSTDDLRRELKDMAGAGAGPSPLKQLTAREVEVLQTTARGLLAKRAAHSLGLREGTIKAHLDNIRRKLGARDTTHAVAIYLTSTHTAALADARMALEWALAEIDGRTRYERPEQRDSARSRADEILGRLGGMQ